MGISQLEIIIKASILPVLVVVLAQFLLKYTPILKKRPLSRSCCGRTQSSTDTITG